MAQVGFRVNRDRCISCRACAVACKAENNTRLGVSYRRVDLQQQGSGTSAYVRYTTMACMHCTNPACLAACPVTIGAIAKDSNGIVLIDQDKCIGCRRCEWACPYGAPQYNSKKTKVEKCTFCEHRNSSLGVESTACAATCPGRALRSYDDISAVAGSTDADGLAPNTLTNPNVKYITGGTEA